MRIKFNFMAVMIIALTTLCGCVVPYESIENEKHIELNFYGNGGLYEGESTYSYSPAETVIIKYSSSYNFSTISKRFTRSGYTLLGWSKSSTATTVTYSATGNGYFYSSDGTSLNLYAVWKSNSNSSEITLSFYANGGYYEGSYVSSLIAASTATVEAGSVYSMASISAKFTYDGYTLLGWSKTKLTPSASLTASDCDVLANGSTSFSSANGTTISLYAVWKKVESAAKVTIKLYGNGGLYNGETTYTFIAAATLEATVGVTYSMANESAKFTYTGYTLLGWSKTKLTPSSSLTVSDCDVLANGSTQFSGSNGDVFILYAVWKTNSSSSSGTIVNDTITVNSSSYSYLSFTLNKTTTLTVKMSCSDKMYYYLIPSDSFDDFKNGNTFSYYSQVSASDGATSVSGSVTVAAGSYYYICQNKNILSSKTVTRKITY